MRKTQEYTFFFSKADVFSNWYPSPFTVRGVSFNCVEQMMMYAVEYPAHRFNQESIPD